jgi:hypothetical protein
MCGVQTVLENGVLRKKFGAKRNDVKGDWRRLHNDELYDLHSSPNFIWVITSRIM